MNNLVSLKYNLVCGNNQEIIKMIKLCNGCNSISKKKCYILIVGAAYLNRGVEYIQYPTDIDISNLKELFRRNCFEIEIHTYDRNPRTDIDKEILNGEYDGYRDHYGKKKNEEGEDEDKYVYSEDGNLEEPEPDLDNKESFKNKFYRDVTNEDFVILFDFTGMNTSTLNGIEYFHLDKIIPISNIIYLNMGCQCKSFNYKEILKTFIRYREFNTMSTISYELKENLNNFKEIGSHILGYVNRTISMLDEEVIDFKLILLLNKYLCISKKVIEDDSISDDSKKHIFYIIKEDIRLFTLLEENKDQIVFLLKSIIEKGELPEYFNTQIVEGESHLWGNAALLINSYDKNIPKSDLLTAINQVANLENLEDKKIIATEILKYINNIYKINYPKDIPDFIQNIQDIYVSLS